METQLAVPSASIVPQGSDNIEVIAETPQEMQESNLALIEWCKQKINAMRTDFIELDASYKSALEKKWKSSVLKRHSILALKRMEFYTKIKTALEMGWYIVPTFPVSVFAIRTDKTKPLALVTTIETNYTPAPSKDQQTASLPHGEGEYVSPNPEVSVQFDGIRQDDKGNKYKKWLTMATDWAEVEFPLCMARPRIMQAVDRAMQIKLFDDFGVLSQTPQRRRGCGDPIIVGRIRDPRSNTYNQRYVAFIIAWSLNTETI